MNSILQISVLEGRDLLAADFGVSSDPYVVLRLSGDHKDKRTRVVEKNLNPVWTDEDFEFDSIEGRPLRGSELLEIKVYDRDRGRFDDFLGSTAIQLEDLVEDWTESWYPLDWKGKQKGELRLRCRLVVPEAHGEDAAWMPDEETVSLHGQVFFQRTTRGLKATGRWKRKYFVSLRALPKSIYCFDSQTDAKAFTEASPDELHHIKARYLKVINLGKATKFEYFDDCRRKGSVSSLGSTPSMFSDGSFLQDGLPQSSSPRTRRRRLSTNTRAVFGCPYPGTVTKISTNGSTYRFCTRTRSDAGKWANLIRLIVAEESADSMFTKNDNDVEEDGEESYTRPDSLNDDETQEEEKLEDVFVENPNAVEHLLEGTVSVQGNFRRRKQYAVLTPMYLALARGVAVEVEDFETVLELSKVLSVTEEKNMQDAAFTIIFHKDAFKFSQSDKLKSMFEEGDFAGPSFERRTFYVTTPRVSQTWVQKIENAVKERQQNLHLWIALEEEIKVDIVQKFLSQGASAGSDNTKNGLLLFHHVLMNLKPKSKDEKAMYLRLLTILADAFPQALKTPIHDTRGLLPLHYSLSSDYPNFTVVQFLLNRARHTAYKRTIDGDAAIHVACRWASPYGVKILLEACSAGSSFANECRQLPLHCAVGKRETESKLSEEEHNKRRVEIMKILLSDSQMASFVASIDKYQATPLHLACKYQGLSVVQRLVRANPKSLWCNDHYHNRPFHYACQRVEETKASLASVDIAVYVGSRFFCQLKNDNDQTPLDLITSPEIRKRVLSSIKASMNHMQRNASSHLPFDPNDGARSGATSPTGRSSPKGFMTNLFACCAGRRKPPSFAEDVKLFKVPSQGPEEVHKPKPYPDKPTTRGRFIHPNGELGPVLKRVNTDVIIKEYDARIQRNVKGVAQIKQTAAEINDMAVQGLVIETEIKEKAETVEDNVAITVDTMKTVNSELMSIHGGRSKKVKETTVPSLDPLRSAAVIRNTVNTIAKS